jgi:predicted regulator of amino acid metabolism with ACT domain
MERLGSMSTAEAVQIDRAAMRPAISTVKRDKTLAITFSSIEENKTLASARSQ